MKRKRKFLLKNFATLKKVSIFAEKLLTYNQLKIVEYENYLIQTKY
ncbi:MAG: hypothetical protein Q3983_04780 [Capnocytophaga sp.]|nr:hypothetical protein [Capnocytophaga sp.]